MAVSWRRRAISHKALLQAELQAGRQGGRVPPHTYYTARLSNYASLLRCTEEQAQAQAQQKLEQHGTGFMISITHNLPPAGCRPVCPCLRPARLIDAGEPGFAAGKLVVRRSSTTTTLAAAVFCSTLHRHPSHVEGAKPDVTLIKR